MIEVTCTGTPFEVGLQHGKSGKKQVVGSMAFYEGLFQRTCALDWDEVKRRAAGFIPSLEQLCPRYLEEMRGLAVGAGVDLLDIIALNVRSEITFGMFTDNPSLPVKHDGCTAFACRNSNGDVYLAQNWDWEVAQADNLLVCHISQPDRPKVTMVTEAGVIGKIGFNSSGVGTCLNAIRAKGVDTNRLPIHLALRTALEATSARAATEAIMEAGVAASAHILVADKDEAIGLECTSQGTKLLEMKADSREPIVHTNHLILNHPHVNEPPWLPDSNARLERMSHLLQGRVAGGDADDDESLFGLFYDEEGYPGAINRCQIGTSEAETLFNITMDLGKKQAKVSFGRPRQGIDRHLFSM
ncbi:AAT-domain-containing protein [Sarocladium strictum]